ncbi:MAG: hypothetical protein GX620_02570 [Chloroflexi bacterium]|nr:hypothetical protein [Chloroflexota bacterium]
MKEIASSIYVSTDYRGPNVSAIMVPGGAVVVDVPTLPQDARDWRQRILEMADGPVLYLVLTDTSPDRLLSAGIMEAPIVATRAAFDQAAAYTEGFWRSIVDNLSRRYPDSAGDLGAVEIRLPEVMFTGQLTLYSGDQSVTVEAVDGAALGSAWVYLQQQDVLIAGDTVAASTQPVMASAPDTEAWLKTLRLLRRKRYASTVVVPGRGPLCDVALTRDLSDYISLARRRVRSLHAAEGSRSDTAPIVSELLDAFPVPEDQRDLIQRRIKAGLDRLYDELKPKDEDR